MLSADGRLVIAGNEGEKLNLQAKVNGKNLGLEILQKMLDELRQCRVVD